MQHFVEEVQIPVKSRISVNLDDAEYCGLQDLAKILDRPLAWLGRRAIKTLLETEDSNRSILDNQEQYLPDPESSTQKYRGGVLHQGDCLEIMKTLDDHSVDLVLCDLPYGTTQNKWDSVIPLDEIWQQYRRIVKPKGVIALTSQGIFTARLILSNESWFRYKFAWIKSKPTNFLNARRQPLRQHEDICIFYQSQPDYRPVMTPGSPYDKGVRKAQYTGSYGDFKPVLVKSTGERFPRDTLYCKTAESEAGGRVWHPTQKPVALGRYLIRLFTGKDDVVLDNAFGSGSFLVAAALEGRRFIGIEKNEEVHLFKRKRIDYMEVARTRLAEIKAIIERNDAVPALYADVRAHATKSEFINHRGMVDVDEIIRCPLRETA